MLMVSLTRVWSVTLLSLLAISVEGLACRAPETHYVMFLFKVKHACAD